MKSIFTFILSIIAFCLYGQINLEHLNCFEDEYNTLSYSDDYGMFLLGTRKGCYYERKGNDTVGLISSKLRGTHGLILSGFKGICTFEYIESTDTTVIWYYDLERIPKRNFDINGQVNSMASTLDGKGLYLAIEYDVFRNYLEYLNLETGERHVVDKLPLALNAVVFNDGKIGLGGPDTKLYKPNERYYRSATLPHLGYIKSTYVSDTIKVLSEISDGAYINLYDSKMKLIKSIDHRWPQSQVDTSTGTRRCEECTGGTLSSFVDFDVSTDGKVIAAKDQYGKVLLLNLEGELLHIFKDSESWWFLHFKDKNTLFYYDFKMHLIVPERIDHLKN